MISIKGREVSIRKPGDAIDNGVALVPEARATQGIIPAHSVASNMVLAVIERLSRAGVVNRKAVVDLTDRQIARLSIKTASRDHAVATLSQAATSKGGDRQVAGHRSRHNSFSTNRQPESTSARSRRSFVWCGILPPPARPSS